MFNPSVRKTNLKYKTHYNFNGNAPAYTPAIALKTATLYNKVKRVINPVDWKTYAPYISEINRLKKEKARSSSPIII